MSYTFRDASATEAKPIVGLYALSGNGKTTGALLLACGFVGGDMSKVGMIETEAGRGEAHANDPVIGRYKVLPLRESFSPATYGAAIKAAEAAKLQALIIDSASHEWEGVGGVLSMIDDNKRDGKKGVAASTQPKMQHNREFMLRITQTPIPLVIVCMRAKYAMYEVTPQHIARWEAAGKPGGDRARPEVGKWAKSWELEPKQSDDILSEMFVHGWIDEEHRFHGTKYTLDALREVFVNNEPITVDTGKRLAAWAAGRTAPSTSSAITAEQVAELTRLAGIAGVTIERLCTAAKVANIEAIQATRFEGALAWLNRQMPSTAPDEAAVIRSIDTAKDIEAAQLILDRHRDAPFYDRAAEAYRNRWTTTTTGG